jgi:heme exporter protein A
MFAGLDIRGIGMSYSGRPLFEAFSLELRAGSRVTVTGPNGSGKTTFLKIVAGLARPTAGEVVFQYDDGRAESSMARRARLVGYAGPDINQYDELSATENLAFHARLRGVDAEMAPVLLDRVGLARTKRAEPLRTFSSGMRQRVRLAASLIGRPEVLIWDEPSVMLDAMGREVVEDLLATHVDAGGLAIVATNDPAEIERWGDRRVHFGG